MDPFTLALLQAGLGAATSIGGGFLSRGKNKETAIQGQQRLTIDDILAGIKGEGPFASLFAADEDTFQKSYVDPAKSMFEKQIAPQIQQQFIASGQQRGTGLEDTLSRAGVDIDMQLAQQYGQFQGDALQRQLQALGGVLSAKPGADRVPSSGQSFRESVGGYLSGDSVTKGLDSIFDSLRRGFIK